MNILGLISQLIGIKTLRLTVHIKQHQHQREKRQNSVFIALVTGISKWGQLKKRLSLNYRITNPQKISNNPCTKHIDEQNQTKSVS